MEPDFSGWATKAGLKCSDGRVIMPDAFKHQDQVEVPLVWQHGHKDVENVLGHVILHNRGEEGVYCDAYFNSTPKAKHAKELVKHRDITQLSIWANDLIERAKNVLHGKIREVSLVLAGANPGALIDPVTIRHSDGELEELEGEAIIYTGLEFEKVVDVEHSDAKTEPDKKDEVKIELSDEKKASFKKLMSEFFGHADEGDDEEKTLQAIYESMNDDQKQLLHYLLGEAISEAEEEDADEDKPVIKQDALDDNPNDDEEGNTDTDPKGNEMKHNVFEAKDAEGNTVSKILTHDDVKGIVASAEKMGSLKEAVESYALEHGIQDIDILFPEAQTVGNTPELLSRRVEWVADLMGKVRKTPFSRIKTFSADLTVAEARAKGYIKGTLKKEEFFRVSRRITTPTTIYKKQKLDRDDIIDITDFDVVTWLKAEMRLMLDEEIARAILVGDGRAPDDEDKINEEAIRPIASDHELFVTTVSVNIGDTNSSIQEALDAIVLNRQYLRGTGMPTMYTTETYIARFLLLKDSTGRKVYRSLDEVATDLRVSSIVPVEILNEHEDILAILVNPVDYTVGADRGGQISMFDDFDIDYNQYKYLIETRMSGALTKLKSAMVIKSVDAAAVLVAPAEPTFDGTNITIVDTTGVVYRRADTDAVVTSASVLTLADGEQLTITAEPDAGYYFGTSMNDEWSFTGEA